jgi:hypothetical protein
VLFEKGTTSELQKNSRLSVAMWKSGAFSAASDYQTNAGFQPRAVLQCGKFSCSLFRHADDA